MAIQQFETARIQMMTRRLYGLLLTALLFFTACSKDEIPEPPKSTEHTMLLYMPGQDLIKYYERNIEGVERAVATGATRNGRMLVCYQPESHDRATLLEISYDARQQKPVRKVLKTYEAFRAETTASVHELFADVQHFAPAESYGLTIGCHGFAWVPAGSPLSKSDHLERPLPGALVTRATRFFGDSGHRLDIAQLADAVAGLPFRFDYLIFDDCFMANIETLYDLRHSFDSIIASPCEIMGAGFPYDRVIPRLFASDGADLAGTCWEFWNFYQNDWETIGNSAQSGCISLAVTSELDALAAAVAEIHAGPTRAYDADALQSYEGMSTHLFYDLDDYIRAICADDNRYARFKEQLNRTFPEACRLYTPSFYSAYNKQMNKIETYSGVTTSEPSQRHTDLHKETAWYKVTHASE